MRRNAPASDRARRDALLAELTAIYADVDIAYAGSSCPASTECCHFGVTGREPYVTSIELALMTRAIAAKGGTSAVLRTSKPRPPGASLPILAEPADATGRCPLLDGAGRCSIYAARPLGCRTFFCERALQTPPVRQREVNGFVRRIQDLAAKHEPSGDRGRPLTRALRSPSSPPRP
jgi:Fe-S-cluster containining protein